MGAQWKQKWRELSANKRGKLFGKLVKEIQVAARTGVPDPDSNSRLAAAMEAARKQSVPKETIDRAVKKGAGLLGDKVEYEEITYEGFGPHKVPVIVECLTDNRNRTASEVRVLFKQGQLGSSGSVAFLFEHVGLVEATHTNTTIDPEEAAINADANEVEELDSDKIPEGQIGATFICNCASLDATAKALRAEGWNVMTAELAYLAKNYPELTDEQREDVEKFLHALDDDEDVHRVYAALR